MPRLRSRVCKIRKELKKLEGTVRLEALTTNSKPQYPGTPYILNLPTELKLKIYGYITSLTNSSLSQPLTNPLYPLLFVNKQLRIEVSNIFYRASFVNLRSPTNCLFFFKTTKSHMHLLRALTFSVPGDKMAELDKVFEELLRASVPLRRLNIFLTALNSRRPQRRIIAGYMLPRRVSVSPLGEANKVELYDYRHVYDGDSQNYIYERDEHCPTIVNMARNHCAWSLGKMRDLRFLRIFGHPLGKESMNFCLSVVKVCERMREVAKSEGKGTVWGKYGSATKREEGWWFEGWIDGEEEEEAKDLAQE